jgi:two-component system phosphate regulon sensor histidine kinase PhoR
MFWPVATFISLAAGAGVHFWWRNRYERARREALAELDQLRRQHEHDTAHALTRQEVLFNSMTDGLLLLNETGRIQLANRAFNNLFEVSVDLRNRTVLEALRLHELAEIAGSLSAEKPALEHVLKLSGLNERWLHVNGAAIFNGNGRRHGTILLFHDLTRLKQLENARQEFVANVSHELRTPLSLIKGYVETLLDGAHENPDVAVKFLHTIDRNAERLKLLIEDLLTISELESGRVRLNLQAVPLKTVVANVFEDFKARAAARGVRLADETPDLTVRADMDRLDQVLSNLVDNAIKYGRAGGTVTVGAALSNGSEVEVSVRDDGPGIPPEALERVFERFFRVDKARSREQGGTGLGLSIVKHIVQGHGGRVWAKSELGAGTCFYFTLSREASAQQPSLL